MKRQALTFALVMLIPAIALADEKIVVESEPIAKIPTERSRDFRLLTNHDLTRIAILDRFENGHWYISVNDRVWEFYDEVDARSAQFSPDGKQLAFFGKRAGKWFLVVENKEIRELGTERPSALVFSGNSARVGTVHTLAGKKQQLCVDGQAVAEYPKIQNVFFGADGKRVFYTAQDGEKVIVGEDEQVMATREGSAVSALHVSKDGEVVTYAVLGKADAGMKIDLVEGDAVVATYPVKGSASKLTLSPDGKHVAWANAVGKSVEVHLDGKVSAVVQGAVTSIVFSPDSSHLACTTEVETPARAVNSFLYIDGEAIYTVENSQSSPVFVADGRLRWSSPYSKLFYFVKIQEKNVWGRDYRPKSADGKIKVTDGVFGICFNDLQSDYEKLLDIRFTETGKAVVLVEAPRSVHVNQKILNQLSRVTVDVNK